MIRINLFGWSSAFVVSALLLAGCGGATTTPPNGANSSAPGSTSASTSGAGSSINGCTLLTESEATALIGSDPGPGSNTGSGTVASCSYGAIVNVSLDSQGSRMAYDGLRSTAQSLGAAGFQDVPGVGDAACLAVIGTGSAFMYIIRGSDLIQILIQNGFSGHAISADALSAEGKTVLSRV